MKNLVQNFCLVLSVFISLSSCASDKINVKSDTLTSQALLTIIKGAKNVEISNKIVIGDLNLLEVTKQYFKNKQEMTGEVDVSLIFKDCKFKGMLIGNNADLNESLTFLKNVVFVNCQFENDIKLNKSKFSNSLQFDSCKFNKNIDFQEMRVIGTFNFTNNSVNKEAFFQNIFLHDLSSFYKTEFNATTYFQAATFIGDAKFNATVFNAYVDFSISNFISQGIFDFAKFKKTADFSYSRFKDNARFVNANMSNTLFKGTTFYGNANFENMTSITPVDFEKSVFTIKK